MNNKLNRKIFTIYSKEIIDKVNQPLRYKLNQETDIFILTDLHFELEDEIENINKIIDETRYHI